MTPKPYTLLSDARFMANLAAKCLQDSKIAEVNDRHMAGFHRGQACGFIIAAKQFVHANKMQRQSTN